MGMKRDQSMPRFDMKLPQRHLSHKGVMDGLGDIHQRAFEFKEIPEDKKVKLVALKLRSFASLWWTSC